jgi:hypothetical protein
MKPRRRRQVKRASYLLALLLCVLVIYALLPRRADNPLLDSFLAVTGLPLARRDVLDITPAGDQLVLRTLRGVIEHSDLFGIDENQARRLSRWMSDLGAQDETLEFLLVSTRESGGYVVGVTLEAIGRSVVAEKGSAAVSDQLITVLLNVIAHRNQLRTTPYQRVSTEALRQSLRRPRSLAAVAEMIRRSANRRYSEVGGLAMVEHDEDGSPVLALHQVRGVDQDFVERLDAAASDFNLTLRIMRANPGRFKYVEFDYQAALRELGKPYSPEQHRRRLDMFLDIYFLHNKMTYEPSETHLLALVGRGLRGEHVAGFHVHPLDNPPSIEDKLVALTRRILVIVPRNRGFDLYDYYPALKDFDRPGLVSYRDPAWSYPPEYGLKHEEGEAWVDQL